MITALCRAANHEKSFLVSERKQAPREIYNARLRDGINSGIDLVVTTRCRVKKERYEMPFKAEDIWRLLWTSTEETYREHGKVR